MTRPRLLDLFCGEGGAGMGYHRAGFDVIGVDIRARPRYPFKFIQADALTFSLDGFDAIHASPPCQRFSMASRNMGTAQRHPDLLTPIRERLEESGRPWIIENVPGAPMRADLVLCGSQFGLLVVRHRWFELGGFRINALVPPCSHHWRAVSIIGNGTTSYDREQRRKRGEPLNLQKGERQQIMQMPWASNRGVCQAIPPAYTEWIGAQIIDFLRLAA